jgi:hypothetical protein
MPKDARFSWAAGIFAFYTIVSILIFLFAPLLAQDKQYHHFADLRPLGGIPNAWNVLSNLPFIIFGIMGLWKCRQPGADPWVKLIFCFLFTSFILTGIGSSYYHLSPNNTTLVLDRLPISLTVAAFLGIAFFSHVGRAGAKAVIIFAALYGVGSVVYWHFSELRAAGDIRYYAFFQFGSLAVIAALLIAKRQPGLSAYFWYCSASYALAKLCESFDHQIFDLSLGTVGGHALKHLFASLVVLFALGMPEKMRVDPAI